MENIINFNKNHKQVKPISKIDTTCLYHKQMTFNNESKKSSLSSNNTLSPRIPISYKNYYYDDLNTASPYFAYPETYSFKDEGIEMRMLTKSNASIDNGTYNCSKCLENKIIDEPKLLLKSKRFWVLFVTIALNWATAFYFLNSIKILLAKYENYKEQTSLN